MQAAAGDKHKSKGRPCIAADGHTAGTFGATGVERLRPRENGQQLSGGKRKERVDFSAGIARFGNILNIEGPLDEIGPRSVFPNSAIGVRQ